MLLLLFIYMQDYKIMVAAAIYWLGEMRRHFPKPVNCRPGGRLQFSGGGSKMAWLASAFSSIRARCLEKVR